MMKRVGLIVNPIAGMGGAVGLKGTDGDALQEALRRGAKPIAPLRALEFLNSIKSREFNIVAGAGIMGEDEVRASGQSSKLVKVIGTRKEKTTREDTIEIAREMRDNVDLLVFVGGDGTARDIYEAVGTSLPVLGVPSGVKMYSSVFAVNPRAAGELVDSFVSGNVSLVEREVLDIDEDAFRRDEIVVRLYGYLLVPVRTDLVQSSKTIYSGVDEELSKESIAEYIVETMEQGIPYILGPGSTVKAICRKLNINCTLLGVDIIIDGKLIVKDAWERDILNVLNRYGRVKIIISPIGGQGFLFGRGNLQISRGVLERIRKEDIIVISTENKLRNTPCLYIDTGSLELDERLSGYYKVLVDYGRYIVAKTC